ncbi:5-hydroxytryptamine receptor 3A [Nelusetta ayraudi]|uniref:5-hydroxytryptamine receptor 3A n=1 Tax=Nelusetta ayraudi TaxID=303726 RepID=UPI003F7256EC
MAALRILAFLASLALCSGQNSDCSYLTLLDHLNLSSSQIMLTAMRPVKDWRTNTTVKIDLLLYGILQVDEKSQTLTSHISLEMSWINEFLMWEPEQFCGISTLQIPASMLWIPDISMKEDASDTSSISSSPLLAVSSDGWVKKVARQRLISTCKLSLNLFPFDTQRCNFTFNSYTADDHSLTLDGSRNNSALTMISAHIMVTKGEWALRHLDVTVVSLNISENHENIVRYTVTIRRKPLLYVVNLIVPLLYLLVLDVASFFIHASKGEKLSFKITVLLSISVLLLILQDMLPSTEDILPYIATYFVAVFALVGISVLESMLVLFVMDMEAYCSSKFCKPVEAEVEIQLHDHESEDKVQVEQQKGASQADAPGGRQLLKQILQEVKVVRQMAANQEQKPSHCSLAVLIDSVFFVFYLFTIIVFLTYMYINWIYLAFA